MLLQPTKDTPKQRFGLSWFKPSIYRYRKVLLEVFIASFFVQMFGLVNPLITQIIIDKVLVQNSINTLHVLGIFLVVVAIFEAVITSLRTNLFVDTTNRIDLALGAQVIDHLLRLPLRYFQRRPVGELSTRVNELNGRVVPLQSGMSVSANIKVRHRTVISIFTDLFTQQVESLKFVR